MDQKCPQCGATTQFATRDPNDNLVCWKCGYKLLRGEELPPAAEAKRARPAASTPSPDLADVRSGWKDPATWFFAAGVAVVLICLFVPLISRAGVSRVEARLLEGEISLKKSRRQLDDKYETQREALTERQSKLEERRTDLRAKQADLLVRQNTLGPEAPQSRRDELLKEDNRLHEESDRLGKEEATLVQDRQNLTAELQRKYRTEEEQLKRDQKDWSKKRDVLDQEERTEAEVVALHAAYWSNWGMLAGLLLLCMGAFGYLGPRQSTVRRVLGAVVLAVVVLLVVSKLAGGRGILAMVVADPLGKGLAAYDFSTPRAALASQLQIQVDQDMRAFLELDRESQHGRLEEKLRTLSVVRTAAFHEKTILFVSYFQGGQMKRRVEAVERDAQGQFRPATVSASEVEASDKALAKEMQTWSSTTDGRELSP